MTTHLNSCFLQSLVYLHQDLLLLWNILLISHHCLAHFQQNKMILLAPVKTHNLAQFEPLQNCWKKLYFVTKIVLTICEKKMLNNHLFYKYIVLTFGHQCWQLMILELWHHYWCQIFHMVSNIHHGVNLNIDNSLIINHTACISLWRSICKKSKWWKVHRNKKSIQDDMWKMFMWQNVHILDTCVFGMQKCHLMSDLRKSCFAK